MSRNRIFGLLTRWRSAPGSGDQAGHENRLRFGLVPQCISLVVIAVLLVGILISAMMVSQSRHTLREQIIANNVASAGSRQSSATAMSRGRRSVSRSSLTEQATVARQTMSLEPAANYASVKR